MTFDDLSDEELARRARDGSAACFEEIVRRYQVPLLRFLLRRSPDPVDAEDALQEAFLRAHQSLNKYRDGRPFKPWMFTLTYRLAVSNARKVRPTANDAAINVATSNDGDPSRNLESRESRQLLWDTARRGLGEEQFVALWLHYAEDMPTRQIAQVMGRSWVWVKTALHRARKKLAETVEPEPDRAAAFSSEPPVLARGES
jgi:RNA polymerase sigma-70 factor (ECF subfamily)